MAFSNQEENGNWADLENRNRSNHRDGKQVMERQLPTTPGVTIRSIGKNNELLIKETKL